MYCGESHTLYVFPVVKRLPEHVQVDNPDVLWKLAKKLERLQVSCLMGRDILSQSKKIRSALSCNILIVVYTFIINIL